MSARAKTELVRLVCRVHVARPEACEPENCGVMENHAELGASLMAVALIADDLVESLVQKADPMLGSALGSALTIRALIAFASSELRSPLASAEDES